MAESATIVAKTAGIDGPSTYIMQGSPDTVFQGLAASRVGDAALPHIRYGSKRPHGTSIATGSSRVLINGIPAAYVGSAMTCGDVIAVSLTPTVLVGV